MEFVGMQTSNETEAVVGGDGENTTKCMVTAATNFFHRLKNLPIGGEI